MGLVVAAEPGAGAAEAEVGMGLPRLISAPPCGAQGGELAGGPVVPLSPPLEELPQRPGKLPGVGRQFLLGGQLDGREQDGVFGLEPDPRLPMVGKHFRYDSSMGGTGVIGAHRAYSKRAALCAVSR